MYKFVHLINITTRNIGKMKPTLFVLAAGMGSRYGGLKQLDGVGPSGETIMDYSIYDAVKAGFGKLVFVIRQSFEEDFREKIVSKYEKKIPVELVFQELDKLPEGYTSHPDRVKPWGTNHALMMGKEVIHEPFAVINADDFYGRESFQVLSDFLSHMENAQNHYCMIGYRVGNTLSDSGTVARGVCVTDEKKSFDRSCGKNPNQENRRRCEIFRRERQMGCSRRQHPGLDEHVGIYSRLF